MSNNISQNKRSVQVGRAIAETTAKAFKLSPTEVIEIFDELKSTILTNNFDESETLEIQRRIAEAKVSVLAGKKLVKNLKMPGMILKCLATQTLNEKLAWSFIKHNS